MKAALAKLPQERRKIITSHDAFGYFGAAYGLEIIAPEGVSTESEASAQDVAKIIRQIKAEHIPAVFMENITDHRLLDQIARETGAKIGGTLYSDALSPARRPGADLSRHVPPQCRHADRGAVELALASSFRESGIQSRLTRHEAGSLVARSGDELVCSVSAMS